MTLWQKLCAHPSRNGYLLLGVGALCALIGAIGTIAFLREVHIGGRLPAGQIAARLILPHITLLFGLGISLTGFILLRRNAVIRQREGE